MKPLKYMQINLIVGIIHETIKVRANNSLVKIYLNDLEIICLQAVEWFQICYLIIIAQFNTNLLLVHS